MSIQLRDGFANETLERTLEDLLVRFIINCPEEDLASIERVLFQIEEAQWFYEDFVRILNPLLPPLTMKSFCPMIIEQFPSIWPWSDDPKEALVKFRKYKSNIPVRGAALLNEKLDKLLLVKGVESSSWGFPRGKISKDESDVDCALRETKEETGFDASDYIDEDTYVERTVGGKNYKIYIISGIPESTEFIPEVRNEIVKIEWKNINKLSDNFKHNKNGAGSYFLVKNMIKPIMNYVNRNKKLIDSQSVEEELKKKATIQIKKLLGVGSENKAEEEQKLDPGRELLNMLHQAAKERQTSTTDIPLQLSNQHQQQQQLPSQPQPDQQLLPPFPMPQHFPGGMPLPINPNGPLPMLPFFPFAMPLPQQQQIQQIMPPMFFPNGFLPPPQNLPFPVNFPMPPPQFQPNPQQLAPPISNEVVPDASSLNKPSFGLANKRSKEANSKELLSLLKSKPTAGELEPAKRNESEVAQASSGNFLRGLFDKFRVNGNENNSTYNGDTKPTAILKREPPAQAPHPEPQVATEEPKKITILKRPDSKESNSKNGKELLNILNNKPTPVKAKSTPSIEKKPNAVEAFINGLSDTEVKPAPFKPMILKRGDVNNSDNNDLLDILKGKKKEASDNASEKSTDATEKNKSMSLLDILKKPASISGSSEATERSERPRRKHNDVNSVNLLNVLKKDEKSVDPSQNLLDLLQGNNDEEEEEETSVSEVEEESQDNLEDEYGSGEVDDDEEGEDEEGFQTASEAEIDEEPTVSASQSLLTTLKAGGTHEPPSSESNNLLNSLKQNSNGSSLTPSFSSEVNHEQPANSSQVLLNILHGNGKQPAPAPVSSSIAQDTSSMASKELLGLLKQPTLSPEPAQQNTHNFNLGNITTSSTSGSNELLNLLKSPPVPSNPVAKSNGSNELLGLLKNGSSQATPPSSNSNELMSILKGQPQSNAFISGGSNDLLNILKGPQSQQPPVQSQAPISASAQLLNTLNGNISTPAPVSNMNQQVVSGSNELLSLLKGGPAQQQSAIASPSLSSFASPNLSASQQLTDILKGNLSPSAPVATQESSSNQLLSLLKGGNSALSSAPAVTETPVAGQQVPDQFAPQQYVYADSDDEDDLEFEDFEELNF